MSLPPSFRLRILGAAALSIGAVGPAPAQVSGIVRPSIISDSTRPLRFAPAIGGFRVGEKMADAVARLGTPTRVDTLQHGSHPVLSVANPRTGVTIIRSGPDGVAVLLVGSRDARELDGIRVGDSSSTVRARWGPPAAQGQGSALWLAGKYVVGLEYDGVGRVTRLVVGIGRNALPN